MGIELTIRHEVQRISRLEAKSKDSSSVVVREREISKVVEPPGVLNDRRSALRTEDQASVGLEIRREQDQRRVRGGEEKRRKSRTHSKKGD